MKAKRIVVILLMLGVAGAILAQSVEDEGRRKRPRYRDRSRFAFKTYYFSDEPLPFDAIGAHFADRDMAGLMQHCSSGLSLKVPIWWPFYLQGEAIFDITTDFEGMAQQGGIFSQLWYGWRNREGYYQMSVPVYLGVRWAPMRIFALRCYAGPVFDFTINKGPWSMTYQDSYWRLAVGVGADLLNVVSVDAGYRMTMHDYSPEWDGGCWFVSASVMF